MKPLSNEDKDIQFYCPVRRIFESYLCLETIRCQPYCAEKENYAATYYELLCQYAAKHIGVPAKVELDQKLEFFFNGNRANVTQQFNNYDLEFFYIANNLKEHAQHFKVESHLKTLEHLIKAAYVHKAVIKHIKFGENLYKQGYFIPANRGRTKKEGLLNSQYRGIITTAPYHNDFYMPPNKNLSFFGPFVSKATDCSRPVHKSMWCDDLSRGMVHPFVNSISGFMIMFLKSFITLWLPAASPLRKAKEETVLWLFRNFISLVVAFFGGHSIYEMSRVIGLDEIKSTLKLNVSDISIFLKDNLPAFDKALYEAIIFSKSYRSRINLNNAFTSKYKPVYQ
ncbi:MAG: hypothetical protein GY750_04705 [Lentisphaerae bacterium]|nr:hypothetical protein [Lentisphaerota bacterium]MCP4100712.1 hypothetical protein [Lentisphaerota bacterium]